MKRSDLLITLPLDYEAVTGHLFRMDNATVSSIHKPLPTSLKRQGYLYKQLKRKGRWAIYEQFSKKTETKVAYEVVKIGKHNGFSIVGLFFPPAETYPASSMWGSRGWTYSQLEDAERSFQSKLSEDEPTSNEDIVEDLKTLKEMFRESEGDTESL